MNITIDTVAYDRPAICTPRVILAMAAKDPNETLLTADCYPGPGVLLNELDIYCSWASTFHTSPKVVNGD